MLTRQEATGSYLLGRAVAWLLVLTPLLAFPLACWAGESGPASLGVLPPVGVERDVRVPREGIWRAPEADFLLLDTVSVETEWGRMPRAAGEPRRGEFAVQTGGLLLFSRKDRGRTVRVRYRFAPRRVALLEAALGPQAGPPPSQALTRELGSWGFVVAPARETTEAAVAEELDTATAALPLEAEKLARVARRLNVAYLLLADLSASPFTRGATISVPTRRRGSVGDHHPRDPFEEPPTISVPVVEQSFAGEVRVVVADGVTGRVVSDQTRSGLRSFVAGEPSAARKALLRDLAREVVAAWRVPPEAHAP